MIIRGTTRVAAVIGWPVEHSRSPAMLNAAFAAADIDAVLVPLAIAPADLGPALRGLAAAGFMGASITAPHKAATAAAADRVEGLAAVLGVANCVVFDGGKVVGHNTDAPGFVDALIERGWAPRGRTAVVLGTGGAARAVTAGLFEAGATIVVVSRNPTNPKPWAPAIAPWTEEAMTAVMRTADLVVDCTDAALDPARDGAMADTLPLAALPSHALVASLVYHRTAAILERAAARDLAILDGRGMLVHQGARAFTLWTGAAAPIEVMRSALARAIEAPAR